MHSLHLRQALSCLVAFIHIITVSSLGFAGLGWAQGVDSEPPTIELQSQNQGISGEAQVFSATVTDQQSVSKVTLYFRFANSGPYEAVPMASVGASEIYVATVNTDGLENDPDFIQYYIEARDEAGNRNLRGFAFDPEVRTLTTPAAEPVVAQQSAPATGISTGRKIAYGLLGIVIVGALASAAGSGGGSDSGPGVPVIVEVETLP